MFSIDVSELNRLSVDLGKASAGATRKASTVVRKSAFDLEAGAKARAAVDTGFMKNSIGVDIMGALHAEVGPTATYAPYQEYGTGGVNAKPPHPFMGPATDAVEGPFLKAMEDIAGDVL